MNTTTMRPLVTSALVALSSLSSNAATITASKPILSVESMSISREISSLMMTGALTLLLERVLIRPGLSFASQALAVCLSLV